MGSRQRTVFLCIWILSTAGLGWLVLQGHHSFGSPATLPALLGLLVCTVALLWWLGGTGSGMPEHAARTRRGRFLLLVLLAVGLLFPLRTLVGPPLLFVLPVVGLVVLVLLRPRLGWLEVTYALLLALLAGVAGLGAGWVTIPPFLWAVLQVGLVLAGLLAGWSLLRHTGLWQAGLGRSLYLDGGIGAVLRGFVAGMVIATPWALGLILLGAANEEFWVQAWWQPLIAIQPAIAEEAWGRALLVPLLFLFFRPVARNRLALTAAVVIMAYWFAYLHTPGGLGAVFSTLMIGTLYAIPTSYLWLRRKLEVAIGFHFWLDFIKFVAAYLLNHPLPWPR
jgi:hypothetical protein